MKNYEQKDIKCDLRPISLTPVLSKVMESIVGEWLWEIICPQIGIDQFGGLKCSSTTHGSYRYATPLAPSCRYDEH